MIYDWYKLFNLTEFNSENLTSKKIIADLESRGENEFLITKGNEVSVLFEGYFLPVNFLNENPFSASAYAVYLDDNNDVWFGFET